MRYRYDKYRFSKRELLLYSGLGIFLGLAVNYLFFRTALGMLLVIPAVILSLKRAARMQCKKVRQTLHYHFKDAVSSIHTALRAGYAIENAVIEAYKDLREMYTEKDILVRELYCLCNKLKLKESVEALFTDLGERSGIEDIKTFAEVLVIAKRTGGNLDSILSNIYLTLSGKIDMKQEIDAAIAAKKFEQTIMSIMPAAIILYLQLSFKELLQVMYQSLLGHIIMGICLLIYGAAFLLGKRIVDVEV